MARSELKWLSETIEINDVSDVVVTDITADSERADNYREIRFFGTPETGVTTIPTVLIVRIRAVDHEKLHVSVPAAEF